MRILLISAGIFAAFILLELCLQIISIVYFGSSGIIVGKDQASHSKTRLQSGSL